MLKKEWTPFIYSQEEPYISCVNKKKNKKDKRKDIHLFGRTFWERISGVRKLIFIVGVMISYKVPTN